MLDQWSAASVSMDEALARLGRRLGDAESDLRLALRCYAVLVNASNDTRETSAAAACTRATPSSIRPAKR